MLESIRAHLSAAGAVLQRDFSIFISYRWRTVSLMMGSVFSLTLFYYVSRLVQVSSFPTPGDYFAFVVVGLVIVQVVQSVLGVALQLRSELVAGTFERTIMSPFGVVAGVMSMMVFPFLTALAMGSMVLLLAVVVFDMPLAAGTIPLAVPVAFLGSLSFAAFGLLFSASTLLFKQASAITFLMAGISIVGGLYFPIDLLPNSIEWLAHVQPFTPTVDLLRHLLSDQPLRESAVTSVLKLVGFAVVMLPLSMAALAAAARTSRRRGTIIEY
jgi:ABC-2 type transport system permease protein